MTDTRTRRDRLLSYLAEDPTNLNLLQDAATACFELGEFAQTTELMDRAAQLGPPSPAMVNLAGLMALHTRRLDQAEAAFGSLLQQDPQNPGLRCNLAWTRSLEQNWPGVCDLLDDATVVAEPRAAALKIRALHHLGRPQDALAWAEQLPAGASLDPEALSALAVAAFDAEDLPRAKTYAMAAGDTPQAATTLGFLSLGEGEPAAEPLFDHALAAAPDQGRALLGKGLARLKADDPAAAAIWLDRAANSLETHLGSWVAAGWAYFVAGDLERSRERFTTALAIDDTFAETHGALAVLDLLQGDQEAARRGVEVSLRLDRQCFAGLLGRILLLQAEGDTVSAERLRTIALNIPIGANGVTLARALAAARR
jgi:tetratricopeptide (TPR) repeat protein